MAVILSTRVKSLLRTSSSSRIVWSWSSPWLLRRRRVGGMAGGDDSFQPDLAAASGKLWMNYTNRKNHCILSLLLAAILAVHRRHFAFAIAI
jgi:hypothetical protein